MGFKGQQPNNKGMRTAAQRAYERRNAALHSLLHGCRCAVDLSYTNLAHLPCLHLLLKVRHLLLAVSDSSLQLCDGGAACRAVIILRCLQCSQAHSIQCILCEMTER